MFGDSLNTVDNPFCRLIYVCVLSVQLVGTGAWRGQGRHSCSCLTAHTLLMQSRALWKRVGSLVAKTVISVLPIIRREYRAKFEPFNKFKQHSRCHNGVVADGCSHSDRRAWVIALINYGRCVQLVGVDVLLDAKGRPWLVECNILPS